MRKRFLTAIALIAGLTACLPGGGGTETQGENGVPPGLTVKIVDSTGAPFGADTVYWSYQADGHAAHKSAHGADTAMKAARRVDSAGTRWRIEYKGLHGAVFIRARRERSHAGDSLCADVAYTVKETRADTLPRTVEIALRPQAVCI